MPRHHPDTRMWQIVQAFSIPVPDSMIAELSREHFPAWIKELKTMEANARQTRKRLEALLADGLSPCPQCGVPVSGRAGRVYCSGKCRVAAHRAAKRT